MLITTNTQISVAQQITTLLYVISLQKLNDLEKDMTIKEASPTTKSTVQAYVDWCEALCVTGQNVKTLPQKIPLS